MWGFDTGFGHLSFALPNFDLKAFSGMDLTKGGRRVSHKFTQGLLKN